MADQKVTELPIKNVSGINLADYLFGIDAAEGYQMLISDLAKKIVETYAGSSLAGSSQTLKNALDTVASKAGGNMATVESSTTASKAYAVGDYMIRNGQLYKVTAAIASGGTITVGTNVTAAAAADDIAGISNLMGDTALGTTAQTITGAIAEHEQDISGLNSKFESGTWTPIIARANATNATGQWVRVGNMVWCSGSVVFSGSQTNQGNIYILDSSLPIKTGSNRGAFGWGTIDGVGDLLIGAALANRNLWISVGGVRLLATTSGVAGKTMQFSICYAI